MARARRREDNNVARMNNNMENKVLARKMRSGHSCPVQGGTLQSNNNNNNNTTQSVQQSRFACKCSLLTAATHVYIYI